MLFPIKIIKRVVFSLITILIIYYGITVGQVVAQGHTEQYNSAQAIVVMGTQVNGTTPSPDLAARLNHAYILYRSGLSNLIIVTGGQGKLEDVSEAQASATFLEGLGIPSSKVVMILGDDTWQTFSLLYGYAKPRNITNILIVSDPFHMDRCGAMATDFGFTPYLSPTQHSPYGGSQVFWAYLKESAEVAVGRVTGYGFLNWLHQEIL